MNKLYATAAALFLFASSSGAFAAQQVNHKKPVVVDPGKGYVLARVGPSENKGQAATIVLFRIDPETSRLRTRDKKSINPVVKGEDSTALIGGNRSFGQVPLTSGQASVFLTSLTPGEWVIVGTQSTCACMGSYRFTVRPGEITDIGTIITGVSDPNSAFAEFRGAAVSPDLLEKPYTVPEAMFARAATESDTVPASLEKFPRTRATLTLTRFDNAGGWMINRMSGLPPLEHETTGSADAVTDPRYAPGTVNNRWPDVNENSTKKEAPAKPK